MLHNNLLNKATGVIFSFRFLLLEVDQGERRYKQPHHVSWIFSKRLFKSSSGVLECVLLHPVGTETYPYTQSRNKNRPKPKQTKNMNDDLVC